MQAGPRHPTLAPRLTRRLPMGRCIPCLAAATARALPLAASRAGATPLYFKNKRVIEVTSYEIKGPLVWVVMGGKKIPMRADLVDWDGTEKLKAHGMVLEKVGYESI